MPYPRDRRGAEGPQSNYRHDPHMLHFEFYFSAPSSHTHPPKILSPELLVRKKLLTTEGPDSKRAGAGEGWVCVLVFQGGRTGFLYKVEGRGG